MSWKVHRHKAENRAVFIAPFLWCPVSPSFNVFLLVIVSSAVLCSVQAEADFFSRVSLSDFNIICTLGIGGFSRVELVRAHGVNISLYEVF